MYFHLNMNPIIHGQQTMKLYIIHIYYNHQRWILDSDRIQKTDYYDKINCV
jgi:hypothetical protein